MIIKLRNFRCFEDNIFNINDKGLTLISGESGKGKSTLLNSILYTLYGCLSKVTSYNKKTFKTTLIYNDSRKITYEICRTKRKSVNLDIYKNDKCYKYENEVAQIMINEYFGTVDKFKLCSYLIQKEQNKIFVSTKSRDDFFKNLIMTSENMEKKQKIKDKIKEENGYILKLMNKCNVYDKELDKYMAKLDKPKKGRGRGCYEKIYNNWQWSCGYYCRGKYS